MYFSKNILGVNPVAMNYKKRHNKNQPCNVRGQTAFSVFGGGRKTGNTVWTYKAMCKSSHGGRLA